MTHLTDKDLAINHAADASWLRHHRIGWIVFVAAVLLGLGWAI